MSAPETINPTLSTYWRREFLEKINEDFAALKANPKAWDEEQEERALWEMSLSECFVGDNQE